MTGEYLPACLVAISDLLLIGMVVLGTRLGNSELKGVPHRLVIFIITASFIIGLLVFLCICLNAYGLAEYHVYDPRTAGERVLDAGEEPPSGLHHLEVDRDHVTGQSIDVQPQIRD